MRLDLTPNVTDNGSPATGLLERVETGVMDVCYFASSYLAGRVPALAAFDLPFPGTDRVAAYRSLDGALGALVAQAVRRDTGYCVLGYWDNGFRHLSNRAHPIMHPRDCRGLTIRTLDNALHHAVFASLGFTPLTVDVRDLREAIQSGRVDAQENPLTNTVGFGVQQVASLPQSHRPFFRGRPASGKPCLVRCIARGSTGDGAAVSDSGNAGPARLGGAGGRGGFDGAPGRRGGGAAAARIGPAGVSINGSTRARATPRNARPGHPGNACLKSPLPRGEGEGNGEPYPGWRGRYRLDAGHPGKM